MSWETPVQTAITSLRMPYVARPHSRQLIHSWERCGVDRVRRTPALNFSFSSVIASLRSPDGNTLPDAPESMNTQMHANPCVCGSSTENACSVPDSGSTTYFIDPDLSGAAAPSLQRWYSYLTWHSCISCTGTPRMGSCPTPAMLQTNS